MSSSSSANTDTNAAANIAASSMMPIRPADLDPELEIKIQEVTKSLPPRYSRHLRNIAGINTDNAATICGYVKVLKTEVSSNDHYRRDTIDLLTRLARNCGDRNFKNLTRDDIIAFLDILRKPDDSDPLHKWIGSYNLFKIQLTRFFKWLYHPDIEADKRQKPHVVENIPSLKRKEKSIYKPSDLWTQQDDLLFLRYCPSKRDKCYHAVSRDLSARPHEILKLKINDLKFKTIGTRQYAEVTVNGKTGTRSIPLINSLPYVKDYLTNGHPVSGNPNSPFICGIGKSLGKHLSPRALHRVYTNYKNVVFPSLLQSPEVMPEDKPLITELLRKPWNPYIRRHSALTEKSMILKEHVLRQHSGWTSRSHMPEKYLHYFGNESSESLLEAYGLIDKGIQIDQLKPKQCPNCNEGCKVDDRFCPKCRMVLSYDAYNETLEQQQIEKSKMDRLEEEVAKLSAVFDKFVT